MKVPARLVSKVRQALARLGICPGEAVVAVSGGPDSVALLSALLTLRREAGAGRLVVAHLNHQLRGADSDRDETFVHEFVASARAAGFADVEFCSRRAAVAEGNVEDTARRVRYQWLAEQARRFGLGVVLTGHTADDQAETVLHRLIRGTGLQGLRGIALRRPLEPGVEVVRPLLGVTRAEVLSYLEAEGQTYRLDRSNADRRYTRNRIRQELLPLLAGYNPGIAGVLCRLAEQAAEAFAETESQARRLLEEAELPRAGDLLIFDRKSLMAAPRHLVREAFRLAWAREGWPMGEMGFEEWDRVAAVVEGKATAAEFPGGLRVRTAGQVVQAGPDS